MKKAETSYTNDARLIYALADEQTALDNELLELAKRVSSSLAVAAANIEDLQILQQLEAIDGNKAIEKFHEALCGTMREALGEVVEELGDVINAIDDYTVRRNTARDLIGRLLGNKEVEDVQEKRENLNRGGVWPAVKE